jgi:hypothetical protein
MKNYKNIQIIDGAQNCTYSIFAASPEDFKEIFPDENQDIEFIQDFIKRVGKKSANKILTRLWSAPIEKKKVRGIHGTLFYELEYKKQFYPTKKEKEKTTTFEP